MFWVPLAAGAGLGLAKHIDSQGKADRERKVQGQIQKWSPWTGMQGQMVQDPGSVFGDIATGAAIGSQFNKMMPDGAAGASSGGMAMPGGQGPSLEMGSSYQDFMNQNPSGMYQGGPWSQMYNQKPNLYQRG